MCLQKKIKDNVKPVHWVVQSQLRSLDIDDFFKITPDVDEKQASVTGNTVKQLVFRGGENPVLLQEEEENVAEDTNDDAGVNAKANEINDKKKDMVVTI